MFTLLHVSLAVVLWVLGVVAILWYATTHNPSNGDGLMIPFPLVVAAALLWPILLPIGLLVVLVVGLKLLFSLLFRKTDAS